jgi:hypothetical protein
VDIKESIKAEIDSASELELFMIVNKNSNVLNTIRNQDNDITSDENEIAKIKDILSYAIFKSGVYGFTPYDDKDNPTDPFYRWFKWWGDYLESLTDEEWDSLNKSIIEGEDLSAFKPKGNWIDVIVADQV